VSGYKFKHPNQWVKIHTQHHAAAAGDENGDRSASGWFPVEMAACFFTAQFCIRNGIELPDQLFNLVGGDPFVPPFDKWCLRSDWCIQDVMPSGTEPGQKGWID
jgi:hypothetical protein